MIQDWRLAPLDWVSQSWLTSVDTKGLRSVGSSAMSLLAGRTGRMPTTAILKAWETSETSWHTRDESSRFNDAGRAMALNPSGMRIPTRVGFVGLYTTGCHQLTVLP